MASIAADAPEEIARILHFMSQKRAAAVMAQAVADPQNPEASMQIHRALLALDVDGATGTQVETLAELYSFMNANSVLSHLADSNANEVANILTVMQSKKPRLVAEILEKFARSQ